MGKTSAGKSHFVEGVHGLRAFAAIAVVIYHAGGAIGSDKYQGLRSVSDLTFGLDSGVDLFFVISGFVISLPHFLGRNTRVSLYLENRLLRIYPISILTASIFISSAWLIYGRAPNLDLLLSSIFLFPDGTDPTPIVLWTLKQELLFYAIFSVVFIRPVTGLALVAFWGFISLLLPHDTTFMKWFFNPHNVQFPLGILAGYLFVNHPLSRSLARWLAAVSMVVFILASFAHKSYGLGPETACVLLGLSGACAVLGAACAKIKIPQYMMFLGTASYSIYLIHYLFISFGNKALMAVAPDLHGANALFVLSALSIAGGCLYFIVFEKRLEDFRHRYLQWKSSRHLTNSVKAAN